MILGGNVEALILLPKLIGSQHWERIPESRGEMYTKFLQSVYYDYEIVIFYMNLYFDYVVMETVTIVNNDLFI